MIANEISKNQTDFGFLDVEVFGNVTEYSLVLLRVVVLSKFWQNPSIPLFRLRLQTISFSFRLTLAAIALPFLLACICPIFVACHILVEKTGKLEKTPRTSENSQKLKKKQLEMSVESPLESCKENTKSCLNAIRELRIPWNANGRSTWSIRHEGESLF